MGDTADKTSGRQETKPILGLTDHVGGSIFSLVFGSRPHDALQLSLRSLCERFVVDRVKARRSSVQILCKCKVHVGNPRRLVLLASSLPRELP